ncbi:MAG: phosphatidate cytidylyltransferase, partial [Acidimicrobiales bacterium]
EAVVVLAAVELFSALRRGGYRPATLLGLAACVALPLAVYWRGEPAVPLVIFLTLVFSILWFLLGVGGSARPVPNIGVTLLGVVYVGFLGSFAALILDVPAEGVSILLVAVVGAVLYDVGGFFIGRQYGRAPLTAVSPNKTVEGLLGGLAACLLGVFITAVLFGAGPFSAGQALVFGLFVAAAAPIGDLAESLLKRDLGLKDMGALLPGHGGVLDRFDGLLFVLPAAYYAARLLDLVPGL